VHEHHETAAAHRRADGDHGLLRCSLLNHLRLPLGLHDVLRDSFGGPGSLAGAGLGAAPTTASAAAAPEGEDLGKKGSKRIKKRKEKGGESWTYQGF
jgi:hypothetical protein